MHYVYVDTALVGSYATKAEADASILGLKMCGYTGHVVDPVHGPHGSMHLAPDPALYTVDYPREQGEPRVQWCRSCNTSLMDNERRVCGYCAGDQA